MCVQTCSDQPSFMSAAKSHTKNLPLKPSGEAMHETTHTNTSCLGSNKCGSQWLCMTNCNICNISKFDMYDPLVTSFVFPPPFYPLDCKVFLNDFSSTGWWHFSPRWHPWVNPSALCSPELQHLSWIWGWNPSQLYREFDEPFLGFLWNNQDSWLYIFGNMLVVSTFKVLSLDSEHMQYMLVKFVSERYLDNCRYRHASAHDSYHNLGYLREWQGLDTN